MYKNRTAYSLTAILLFIIVIIIVSYHGYNSRIFASARITEIVDSPEKAYLIWKEKKVKGRILLLFDSYPHMWGLSSYNGAPQLTQSNLLEFGVLQNIIRKIYFIVPDNAWEDFRLIELMHPIRNVPGLERGLFLYNLSGIPMIATTPTSLPQLSEEVLVYINNGVYNDAQARELLSLENITSDIIISYKGRH